MAMEGTRQELSTARIKREMFLALVFTVITLLIAGGLLTMMPRFQEYLRDVDPELLHSRTFEMYPDGGAIVYAPAEGSQATPQTLGRYRLDLEILSRRFQRGEFEMATLSGLRNSGILKAILQHTADYSYTVEPRAEMIVLRIKSSSRPGTEALQNYLRFLEKHWTFEP